MSIDGPKRTALDTRVANDLRQQLQTDSKQGIQKAAKEFESMFLNIMLKSMRDTVPQDGLMQSDQTRFYTTMLDQQLAQDLASKGGLGLAKMLENQFARSMSAVNPASLTGEEAGSSPQSTNGLSPAAQTLLQNLQQLRQIPVNLPEGMAAPSVPSTVKPAEGRSGTVQGVEARLGGRGPGDWSASTPGDFVSKVWPHAVEVSRVTGIPPQFMVAQAALETGWGRHEMLRADGRPTYNLFGVKASRNWRGDSVDAETSEFQGGVEQRVVSSFRAYSSYTEAFQDYAQLLRNNPRYGAVIGSQDGMEFARRLQQAGYASDPQYAEKLARIINGPTLRQVLAG